MPDLLEMLVQGVSLVLQESKVSQDHKEALDSLVLPVKEDLMVM